MSASSDDASPKDPNTFSQALPPSPVSARVPEKVGHGVFSTGVLVLQTGQEFVLDFVQGMVQPRQVAARVVLPPSAVPPLIDALRNNLNLYQSQYGPPPTLRPPAPGAQPPSTEDIYSQLKLPDDVLAGVYAHAAMIIHTQGEFCVDFITTFYPRPAVSARVFLAAPQVSNLVNALAKAFDQFRQRQAAPPGGPHQPPPPN
jgi:hypothetical protein